MERYFTKTFKRFLIGFLIIIGIAFGIMLVASYEENAGPAPVDNYATPQ